MQDRQVSVVRLFFRLKGWMFLIPLAVGLLTASFASSESTKANLLAEDGVESVATVISKRDEIASSSGSSRSNSRNYYVTYRFEADGIEVTGTQGVYDDFYARVSGGDEIPVRYARNDTSISEVEYGVAETSAIWIGIVAALFLMAALTFLLWRGRLIRSALRAARQGAVGEVRITAHKSAAAVGGKRRSRLVWSGPLGTKGQSLPIAENRLELYPVGESVVVYADPGSKRLWWEQDLGLKPQA